VDTPPTHRVADGSSVAFPVAIEAWAEEAVTILRQTATAYLSVITYGELGESVQEHSGIRTRSLLVNWIGTVLENVARCCHEDGELLLTALCVHQDGTVGSDYAGAASIHEGQRPDDPEFHAAEERLRCYKKYARDLPDDGGRAQLTTQEAARRRARTPAAPAPRCAVHNLLLPRSGQCDYC